MTRDSRHRPGKHGQSLNIWLPEGDDPVFTIQVRDDVRLATSDGRIVAATEYPKHQVHIPSAVRVHGTWMIPPAALRQFFDSQDLAGLDQPAQANPGPAAKTSRKAKQSSKDSKSKRNCRRRKTSEPAAPSTGRSRPASRKNNPASKSGIPT